MTEPILTYPNPNLPYVLFTDASKYAWACVLTQEKTHTIEEKNVLTRKNVTFEWTLICQESFEMLKTSLMTEPILTYPDPNLPYVLFTDASKYAWGLCVNTRENTYNRRKKR